MNNVFLAGVAQLPVNRDCQADARSLGTRALRRITETMHDGGREIDALYVANMSSGVIGTQQQLGAAIAEGAGLSGVEAVTLEAACASGGAAARIAYLSVAGGAHDVVAVCGVECMAHATRTDVTRALALAADWDLESSRGESFITLNAKLMSSYMTQYHVTSEAFAPFAIVSHQNALNNPNALFHKPLCENDYRQARRVHGPLRLFDVSPICNGSAVILFASTDGLARLSVTGKFTIQVIGSAMCTEPIALERRESLLHLQAAKAATWKALAQARIGLADVDLFELHDAYTIMSVLSLEAAGFARPGEGTFLGLEGRIAPTGDIPICTMGGLKGRGHPVGATGIYQLVEAYLQLSQQAGAGQIDNPEVAMVQNIGGTASTVVSHVLRRLN